MKIKTTFREKRTRNREIRLQVKWEMISSCSYIYENAEDISLVIFKFSGIGMGMLIKQHNCKIMIRESGLNDWSAVLITYPAPSPPKLVYTLIFSLTRPEFNCSAMIVNYQLVASCIKWEFLDNPVTCMLYLNYLFLLGVPS